jgi:hypothetical protein
MSLSHIELCLRDGYRIYQTGSTSYAFKQRLGSELVPVRLYYKHRNPLINWCLCRFMAATSVTHEKPAAADV